jgi:hypothetical protein
MPTLASSGSVGDPGYGAVIDLRRQAEQRVADDDAGVIAGHVRELVRAGDIADRVDAAVRRAQMRVDLDAIRRMLHARRVEIQILHIGPAPRRDEQMRAGNPPFGSAVIDNHDRFGAGFDPLHLGAFEQGHAVTAHPAPHDIDEFRIVLGEDRWQRLDHGDLRAEAAMRLRQLAAVRSAADDDQVPGPRVEIENRLVGEVRHVREARDRRHCGRRARRDHEAPGPDREIAAAQFAGAGEAQFAGAGEGGTRLDHLDAEAGEAFDGIVGRDRRDHAAQVRT